jgi:hypothetical protein
MPDLRPMEFGEVLDGALTLFRRHFGLFLRLSLAVMWLPIAFSVYWRTRFVGLQGATPDQTIAFFQTEMASLALWTLAMGIAYGAGMLLLTAGSIRIISDSYLGRVPQIGEALRFGLGKIIPLFLVGLGKSILLGLLAVACVAGVAALIAVGRPMGGGIVFLLSLGGIVGAIWLVLFVACGYIVTTPVVVLETLPSAFDSFGRSWELTRGAKRRLLGLVFVAWLIASFLPALVLQAVGAVWSEMLPGAVFVWTVIAAALPVALAPIIPCVLTLAYYDRRVRREGFDLQLLSEQLGTVS